MDAPVVLDLFCGMGGLALGFAKVGFRVTGYDIHPRTPDIFSINCIGKAVVADLTPGVNALRLEDVEWVHVITGGPPCRPWSALNAYRERRGPKHPDHRLLGSFFSTVDALGPEVFFMENVPNIASDPVFREWLDRLDRSYQISHVVVRYDEYGAPTSRRRLIVCGFRRRQGRPDRSAVFMRKLMLFRKPPVPSRTVLEPFIKVRRGSFPDHEWPNLRTISRYQEKYKTGQYGWCRIDPELPAPSFGNVAKTYVLNPLTGFDGIPLRVISVREAMALMGFDYSFRFPRGMGMRPRYQMVADAVSPVFSQVAAEVIMELL